MEVGGWKMEVYKTVDRDSSFVRMTFSPLFAEYKPKVYERSSAFANLKTFSSQKNLSGLCV
jgi:hypothetical protein